MTFKKPYNDEDMTYDLKRHRYILTINYAKSLIQNAYKDDYALENRLKEISSTVYNYIYNRGNSYNKKYTRLFLNATENGRELIKEALEMQLNADADNGYNDIGKQNPIDFNTGNTIAREKIIENIVTPECANLIDNSASDLGGYSIVCQIAYNFYDLDSVLKEIEL